MSYRRLRLGSSSSAWNWVENTSGPRAGRRSVVRSWVTSGAQHTGRAVTLMLYVGRRIAFQSCRTLLVLRASWRPLTSAQGMDPDAKLGTFSNRYAVTPPRTARPP